MTTSPSTTSPQSPSGTPGSASVVQEAVATASAGEVSTADDVLSARTRVAGDDAEGATTPEHLMAAALAACLQQAVVIAASSTGADASDARVEARVTLTSGVEAGYTSSFALTVSGLAGDGAQAVFDQARQLCPFTKALSGADLRVELAA